MRLNICAILNTLAFAYHYEKFASSGFGFALTIMEFKKRKEKLRHQPYSFGVAYRPQPAVGPLVFVRTNVHRFYIEHLTISHATLLTIYYNILLVTVSLSLCGKPFTDSYHTPYHSFITVCMYFAFSLSPSHFSLLYLTLIFSRAQFGHEKKKQTKYNKQHIVKRAHNKINVERTCVFYTAGACVLVCLNTQRLAIDRKRVERK